MCIKRWTTNRYVNMKRFEKPHMTLCAKFETFINVRCRVIQYPPSYPHFDRRPLPSRVPSLGTQNACVAKKHHLRLSLPTAIHPAMARIKSCVVVARQCPYLNGKGEKDFHSDHPWPRRLFLGLLRRLLRRLPRPLSPWQRKSRVSTPPRVSRTWAASRMTGSTVRWTGRRK